jgi:hypothetical protein
MVSTQQHTAPPRPARQPCAIKSCEVKLRLDRRSRCSRFAVSPKDDVNHSRAGCGADAVGSAISADATRGQMRLRNSRRKATTKGDRANSRLRRTTMGIGSCNPSLLLVHNVGSGHSRRWRIRPRSAIGSSRCASCRKRTMRRSGIGCARASYWRLRLCPIACTIAALQTDLSCIANSNVVHFSRYPSIAWPNEGSTELLPQELFEPYSSVSSFRSLPRCTIILYSWN